MKILCMTCSLGVNRFEWGLILRGQKVPLGQPITFGGMRGLSTCDARNVSVQNFLDRDFDYLMFYDDDMIPHTPDAITKLVSAMNKFDNIAVLSGIYPMKGDPPSPIAIKERSGGVYWGWEDGQLHKVFVAGTGLMVMRREIVEVLAEKDEKYEVHHEGEDMEVPRIFDFKDHNTDDFVLADKLEENGMEWYVHGGVTADQIAMDGNIFRFVDAKDKTEIVD